MSPCFDAPCCGCCTPKADSEPPEELESDESELDDALEEDGELARDRVLDEQERSDFAYDWHASLISCRAAFRGFP